ncbi:MAG: GMC family oxidoreductase [Gammaproteobacteria bacterium]|nr:GMC family oxidoreductase [Gammaproteobacteria bacterium]MDH5651679.1 GMC family oxidoreductase [Gammaproteobacteria bacterium]
MKDYDVCIIGSGAGGAPVALELSRAGYEVVVLEKGPWLKETDFYKDELACCRRSVYTPSLKDEQHVIEDYDGKDAQGKYKWTATPTSESGSDFWNGNVVGGSSNFMSGFFYRLKPQDFRLLSEFGPIKGANIVDWPIGYDELEPYYTKVESEVGVSGVVMPHPFAEPRSTPNFPFPPTVEHPISQLIDQTCQAMQLHPIRTPRAVLPQAHAGRRGCEYSGYCGSYGCSSGAKGSARAALLDRAVATGKCQIIPRAKVQRLVSDAKGKVTQALYVDAAQQEQTIRAKLFVVACQAIETARLLLQSTGPKHPRGLGNNTGQVGRNLVFSAGGTGGGEFPYAKFGEALKARGPFVNRGLQDWYFIQDKKLGRLKGGTIDLLLRHPNPIARANSLKRDEDDKLLWGSALKQKLKTEFTRAQSLRFEVFNDWLPTDDCFVTLDGAVKDKWQTPVAKIRVGYHDHDLVVAEYLSDKAKAVLRQMGAENISGSVSGSPPPNLVAGGCRFGNDPNTSVLDKTCRVHDVPNLFVTDGSFMPTGGSVPYTWTIYANAFRVAEVIRTSL